MKLLLLLLLFASVCNGQDLKFSMPLKGEAGKDFFIDYYPDRDPTKGVIDVFCGSKTYNGHSGTDFILSGYKKMDSGVYVYAVADGRVFEVSDGEYDRSKELKGGGMGNHVVIIHDGGIKTYYGQMRKYSLLVKKGDDVKEGQPIGMVGSSGLSDYPHLHFEVQTNEGTVIDPFKGNCSPRTYSFWRSQPKYDTSLFVIDCGFVPYVPQLDTLQEGYLVSDTFYVSRDTTVCFWALVHGLRKGDLLHAEWYRGDDLKNEYSYRWKYNMWHDYTWTYIKMPRETGKWTVLFYVNSKRVASRNFQVENKKSR
jgi:murein DD-endopeptidase